MVNETKKEEYEYEYEYEYKKKSAKSSTTLFNYYCYLNESFRLF